MVARKFRRNRTIRHAIAGHVSAPRGRRRAYSQQALASSHPETANFSAKRGTFRRFFKFLGARAGAEALGADVRCNLHVKVKMQGRLRAAVSKTVVQRLA